MGRTNRSAACGTRRFQIMPCMVSFDQGVKLFDGSLTMGVPPFLPSPPHPPSRLTISITVFLLMPTLRAISR